MTEQGEPAPKPTPPTRRSWTDLGPRVLSALVLLPITAAALYFGGYVFAIVVGAVFAGAYREWETIVTLKPLSPTGGVLIGLVALSGAVFPAFGPWATLATVGAGALISVAVGGEGAIWRVVGLLYFGCVIIATLAMRGMGDLGIWAGVFLGSVIWLTDTGAFFAGRQIGGEKLAPGISPSKTWSGAFGGWLLGTIAGLALWIVLTDSPIWIGILLAGAMSVLGQLGDLAESALKRHFRIKDSGDIIPGHGGLMDRLDSVTFGVLFLFLVGAFHAGIGDVAGGFLIW